MPSTAARQPPGLRVRTVLEVAAAAVVGGLLDHLWAAQAHAPEPPYVAWYAVLTVAAVLTVGGAAALVGAGVAGALGLWAALHGLVAFDSWSLGLVLAAALGLVSWAFVRRAEGRFAGAAAGVGVGAGLALGFVLWPQAAVRLGLPRADTAVGAFGLVAVFAAWLAALAGYARLRRSRGWRLPETVAAPLAMGALFLTAAALSERPSNGEASQPAATIAQGAAPPSILVLVLDTVRADRLSVYGHERDTSPFLERLVAPGSRAVFYPLAFAPSNWTQPSHVSLLTGELPSVHGVHTRRPAPGTPPASHRVIRAEETLAERLQAAGYRTAAVLANVLLTEVRGIRRGFDRFVVPSTPRVPRLVGERLRARWLPRLAARSVLPYPPAAEINRRVLEVVDGAGGDPFFILANYMDAHSPYIPPPSHDRRYTAGMPGSGWAGRPPVEPDVRDSPERLAHAAGRYEEEIRGLDAELGRLFEELDRRGALDDAWVFITSDHGEAFGEHGAVFHASSIYNEQVRIPLIVQPPVGERLTPVGHAVDLLDVTATVAAIAGEPILGRGRDLRTAAGLRPVQIEFFGNWKLEDEDRLGPLTYVPARAVVARTTKLIEYPDRRELFELAEDPREAEDLASRELERVDALVSLLPPLDAAAGEGEALEELPALSEDDLQKLRALGYVD